MRIIDVQQGSPEWKAARLGIPTASNFDKIVTPGGKLSTSKTKYAGQLIAEWFLGEADESADTMFMERGKQMEPIAAKWYAFECEVDPVTVGLCLTDDGRAGASPDRLVGDDGLLEIKCPSAPVHMGYLLGGIASEYKVQVQGQLWVTGREWCDLLSYHPSIPCEVHRFTRDDDFIDKLAAALGAFCDELDEAKGRLADRKAEYDAQRADWLEAEAAAMELPAGIC